MMIERSVTEKIKKFVKLKGGKVFKPFKFNPKIPDIKIIKRK